MDEYTCTFAAERGRLDIVQYAHENGCVMSDEVMRGAAAKGALDVTDLCVF